MAVCAKAPHRYGSLHATQSYLPPGRGSISCPYLGHCYSIYVPVRMKCRVVDLNLYRSADYTTCQLVKTAFCPTRPSRCEQLAVTQ